MNKGKINEGNLGLYLIILGLIIMVLAIPVESLNVASMVSIKAPGGAEASIEGIKPVSATMLFVGIITTSVGLIIKYKNL